jgi:hypothetical protein
MSHDDDYDDDDVGNELTKRRGVFLKVERMRDGFRETTV